MGELPPRASLSPGSEYEACSACSGKVGGAGSWVWGVRGSEERGIDWEGGGREDSGMEDIRGCKLGFVCCDVNVWSSLSMRASNSSVRCVSVGLSSAWDAGWFEKVKLCAVPLRGSAWVVFVPRRAAACSKPETGGGGGAMTSAAFDSSKRESIALSTNADEQEKLEHCKTAHVQYLRTFWNIITIKKKFYLNIYLKCIIKFVIYSCDDNAIVL